MTISQDVVYGSIQSLNLAHSSMELNTLWCAPEQLVPASSGARWHLILQGPVRFQCQSAHVNHSLQTGDLVLVSAAAAQTLVGPDHGPEPACVISCLVPREETSQPTFFDFLPPVTRIPAGSLRGPEWLGCMGRLMQLELEQSDPDASTILNRYLEMVLAETLFYLIRERLIDKGILLANDDKRLIASLAAIHAKPATTWTVKSLAEQANMSRSLYARRFSEIIQDTPQNYLRKHRIRIAARMLRETDASVEGVAEAVGYHSRSAFTKAFSRSVNMTPGRFRNIR